MKIGDYVRTKNGIAKIIGKNNDVMFHYPDAWETDTFLEIYDDTEYVYDEDISKSSSNIIDLIEVGDIITNQQGEIIVPTGGNIDELKDTWKIFKNIKSIVTKEQFESMEYKLGGI